MRNADWPRVRILLEPDWCLYWKGAEDCPGGGAMDRLLFRSIEAPIELLIDGSSVGEIVHHLESWEGA